MKIGTPPLTRRPDAVSRPAARPVGRWTGSALAAAVLAPALMLAASGWLSWTIVWRTAEAEVGSAADAAAQYARRLLEGQLLRTGRANDVLAGLADEEVRAREPQLHAALRAIAAEGEPAERETFYLFVYDRDARALVSSNVLPVAGGRPLLDRDFNQALRGPGAPAFHVSQLHVGRDTGRPFFAISAPRARTGNGLPPGAYEGVINASVFVDRVNTQLADLGVHARDVVSLVRSDGAVLARSAGFGGRDPAGLRVGPESPMLAIMARGQERALGQGVSTLDGVERVVAYRRVGGAWPVYASVARDRAAVVAAWRAGMLPQAALAAASTLLLLALTLALSRRQRALLAANASLEARVAARTAALAENERFLRLAQQAAGAASWSWRPDTGEVRVSPELYRLLGLEPPSEEPTHFGGFMDVVHPDDLERLRHAHQTALREGAMQIEVRVFRRMPGGGREERWLFCRARRYGGGTGEPVVVSGVDLDITERRRAEERFEAAAEAMEGFVYETDLGTGRVRHTAGVAALLGEEVEGTTAAWLRRVHPEDLPRLEAEMRPVTAPHGPERYAVEYRVRRADGGWLWLLDRGRAFRDPGTGAATRLVGGAVDITGRRLAEERQALLMREVDHRAKNALAVVSAALRLTRGDDVESYRAAVESRVAALARAQSILADSNWLGTDLREVVRQCLVPFLVEVAPEGRGGQAAPEGRGGQAAPEGREATPEGRAVLEGPDVTLAASATQPLSMALHELATNATKYGALSCPEGRLRVAWRLEGGRLVLRWEETGGPEIGPEPARRGFGTRVIDSTVRSQLGGEAVLDWRREGLAAEFSLPAERTLSRG